MPLLFPFQLILDPSRNFAHYRNLLSPAGVGGSNGGSTNGTTSTPGQIDGGGAQAPMLPYLPLVLKDLTFIHLGNPSRCQQGDKVQLINFSKLRMFAKEVGPLISPSP